MSAEKISQVTALQQQQDANAAKQSELKRQAFSFPEGPQRDALLAQRDQLKADNKALQAQINTIAPDNPATSVYEGVDKNSGQHVYVNSITGQRYVDPTPPGQAQKSNTIPATENSTNSASIAADNKAAQQGYAGSPEPVADKPANVKTDQTSPIAQEGINNTVETGTDSGVDAQSGLGTNEEIVQPQKSAETESDPSQTSPYGELHETPEVVAETEDPMAAALAANQTEETPGPTEQDVINASDDPQLSKQELAKLEEEQEYNRAKLKMQETEAEPGTYTASSVDAARASQTVAVTRNTIRNDDWRVHLSLAPSAKYLYNSANPGDLLYPVKITDGVVFPYTPTIQTMYKANYENMDLTHSNYRMFFYKNSSVDDIQITAEFTAQDTTEANYLLSVIHFFKCVTKMFYGQDGNNGPKAGTPPPLCYLNGYGQYQFNEHPVLVTSFSYSLPNDVDYIRAGSVNTAPGTNTDSYKSKGGPAGPAAKGGFDLMKWVRTSANNLLGKQKGKAANNSSADAKWVNYAKSDVTYVPTKMQIQLTLHPVVTRNDISKNFSLEKYATGELLKGKDRPSGGGIW